jgi:hypothetical protein
VALCPALSRHRSSPHRTTFAKFPGAARVAAAFRSRAADAFADFEQPARISAAPAWRLSGQLEFAEEFARNSILYSVAVRQLPRRLAQCKGGRRNSAGAFFDSGIANRAIRAQKMDPILARRRANARGTIGQCALQL